MRECMLFRAATEFPLFASHTLLMLSLFLATVCLADLESSGRPQGLARDNSGEQVTNRERSVIHKDHGCERGSPWPHGVTRIKIGGLVRSGCGLTQSPAYTHATKHSVLNHQTQKQDLQSEPSEEEQGWGDGSGVKCLPLEHPSIQLEKSTQHMAVWV